MQQQVHRAQSRDAIHQLDAEERAALELLLLRPVERVMLGQTVVKTPFAAMPPDVRKGCALPELPD
jgi:hypothetical protein